MVWFILGVMIWGVLMLLVTPLVKKGAPAPAHTAEIAAYKNEIARLSDEIGDGENPELEARKIELQRQLLKLVGQAEGLHSPNLWVINGLFVFFIAGGLGLYALLGRPDLTKPGALQAEIIAPTEAPATDAEMDDLLAQLKSKLESDKKDDANGWLIYARNLVNVGRFEEGFAAYDTAISLTDDKELFIQELALARKYADSRKAGGPSQADMEAAAALTPEERNTMVQGMVDGLSARLIDNPEDPEGWIRLLNARKVLGQDAAAADDIKRLRATYADRPEVLAGILSRAGWQDQP